MSPDGDRVLTRFSPRQVIAGERHIALVSKTAKGPLLHTTLQRRQELAVTDRGRLDFATDRPGQATARDLQRFEQVDADSGPSATRRPSVCITAPFAEFELARVALPPR